MNGFRFVRLNTQEAQPIGISSEQIEWFRAELNDAEAHREQIVIFQHNYPYQIWEDFTGPGVDDWRVLVQARRIEGIICGHTHYWQVANDGRNAMIAVRSIGDPEGGPPGYAVVYCRGDDLAATYRWSTTSVQSSSLRTHGSVCLRQARHLVAGPTVTARIWSAAPVWAAPLFD